MLGMLSTARGALIGGALAALVAGAGTFTWQEIRWREKSAAREAAVAAAQQEANRSALRASELQIARAAEERQTYERQIARGRADLRRVLERLRDHAPAQPGGGTEGEHPAGGDGAPCACLPLQSGEDLARLAGRADETARALALCQSTVRELVRVIESVGMPAK